MPAIPRRVAPTVQSWTVLQENPQDPLECGGLCRIYPANNPVFVGQIVYFAGVVANVGPSVDTSIVAANHQLLAGVVVGGQRLGVPGRGDLPFVTDDPSDVGVQVAIAGELAVVMYSGVAYVIADAAIAAVGTRLAPSTTVAGRVRPATDPVVAAGATAVTSTAANGAIITGDGFGRIVGRNLEVAAGAGSAIRALINFQ